MLSPDTRKSLVQNLVMLRNKDAITSTTYVQSDSRICSSSSQYAVQSSSNTFPSTPPHHLIFPPCIYPPDNSLRYPHCKPPFQELQAQPRCSSYAFQNGRAWHGC